MSTILEGLLISGVSTLRGSTVLIIIKYSLLYNYYKLIPHSVSYMYVLLHICELLLAGSVYSTDLLNFSFC